MKAERPVWPGRLIDHLLKDGPIVVERRSSRFAEDLDDVPPLALAVRATLGDLVRQRKVAFGLPRRRDAGVNGGAGHGSVLVEQDRVDLVAQKGAPEGDLSLEGSRKASAFPVREMNGENYIHRMNCEFAGYADKILAEKGVTCKPVYWSERDDWTLAMIAAAARIQHSCL